MKQNKIVTCFLAIMTLFMTGCQKEALNLERIQDEVTNLKKDLVEISMITNNLEYGEDPIYKDMIPIYDYDFEKTFQIERELYEEGIASIKENEKDPTMYLLIVPKKETKEEVKKAIDRYFDQLEKQDWDKEAKSLIKNRKELEVDGILVYLINSNGKEAEKIVRDSKVPLFSMIMNLTDDNLESMVGINKELLEEYVVYIPMAIVNTNLYMVLKPKEGKIDEVKKQVETYIESLEKTFETYLPDQYQIIKNRKETTYGDYLIYIASEDNERVLRTIKNCK